MISYTANSIRQRPPEPKPPSPPVTKPVTYRSKVSCLPEDVEARDEILRKGIKRGDSWERMMAATGYATKGTMRKRLVALGLVTVKRTLRSWRK